jgi:predicted DNA-binding WGR domain protein
MIERDLFGTIGLVRNWGRIGTNVQEGMEIYDDEIAVSVALATIAWAKRRRGYRDL